MSRCCGLIFVVALGMIFPFPNPLGAPGHGELPSIGVPDLRTALSQFPAPAGERLVASYDQVRWYQWSVPQALLYVANAFRGFLTRLVAFSDTTLSPFRGGGIHYQAE